MSSLWNVGRRRKDVDIPYGWYWRGESLRRGLAFGERIRAVPANPLIVIGYPRIPDRCEEYSMHGRGSYSFHGSSCDMTMQCEVDHCYCREMCCRSEGLGYDGWDFRPTTQFPERGRRPHYSTESSQLLGHASTEFFAHPFVCHVHPVPRSPPHVCSSTSLLSTRHHSGATRTISRSSHAERQRHDEDTDIETATELDASLDVCPDIDREIEFERRSYHRRRPR